MRIFILILLSVFVQVDWVHGQQAIESVVEGVTFNFPGNQTFSSLGNLVSPKNPSQPVNISNAAQINYRAQDQIQLLNGFWARSFSGSGCFDGRINQGEYAIEINSLSIPEFEKMELSIKTSAFIAAAIHRFIANTSGTKLNPFAEDSVSVEATFTSPITHTVHRVYGYYSEDYHYLGPDPPVDGTTTWSTPDSNEFKFKVRFAPDEIGTWDCHVELKYPSLVNMDFTFDNFTFQCIASPAAKGYVEVGNNNYLRFSKTHETFFPIGAYVGWANYRWSIGGATPNPWTQYPETVSPAEYDDFMHVLNNVKDGNGNYVRIIVTQSSWGLEWEKLGNYYDRLPLAWELDKVVQYCEQNGIYINLCISHAGDLEEMNILNTNETCASHFGPVWDENPYKRYLLSQGFSQPIDPTLFITNNSCVAYFKRYVRYMVSRFAYSTHVAKIELMNEGTQIGHVFENGNYATGYSAYGQMSSLSAVPASYQYSPSSGWLSHVTGNSFAKDLAIWNQNIASYIRNDLGAKQIINVSQAGEGMHTWLPSDDQSNSSPLIGITGQHNYFSNWCNGNLYRAAIVRDFLFSYNKPFLFEELDNSYAHSINGDPMANWDESHPSTSVCAGDVEYHNYSWALAFSGALGTTPVIVPGPAIRTVTKRTESFFKNTAPALALFFSGVDLDTYSYNPRTEPSSLVPWDFQVTGNLLEVDEDPFEKFILEGSVQSMGWIHLRRWYWATADDNSGCGFPDNYPTDVDLSTNPANYHDYQNHDRNDPYTYSLNAGANVLASQPTVVSNQNLVFNNMATGSYQIDWYNTRDGSLIPLPLDVESNSSNTPLVFQIPPLGPMNDNCPTCNADVAFKVHPVGYSFRTMTDVGASPRLLELFVQPNPSTDVFTIATEQQQGVIQVFDVMGNKLTSIELKEKTKEYLLDLSKYPKGIYFLNMISDGQRISKKIVLE